jgi:hypothetical protein
MPRHLFLAIGSLANLALLAASPAPALAAATIPLPIDAGWTLGNIDRVGGNVTFAARLDAGTDYAFSAGIQTEYGGGTMELSDPAGRIVRSVATEDGTRRGLEFRPAASATYFLRVRLDAVPDDGPDQHAVLARVDHDCRGGVSTRCTLKPGAASVSTSTWWNEFDFHRVRLTAGRAYLARVTQRLEENGFREEFLVVEFRDSRRRTLARSGTVRYNLLGQRYIYDGVQRYDRLGRPYVEARFVPPVTGDYWVNAAGGDFTIAYEVVIRQLARPARGVTAPEGEPR